jgi:hypothetical protein
MVRDLAAQPLVITRSVSEVEAAFSLIPRLRFGLPRRQSRQPRLISYHSGEGKQTAVEGTPKTQATMASDRPLQAMISFTTLP